MCNECPAAPQTPRRQPQPTAQPPIKQRQVKPCQPLSGAVSNTKTSHQVSGRAWLRCHWSAVFRSGRSCSLQELGAPRGCTGLGESRVSPIVTMPREPSLRRRLGPAISILVLVRWMASVQNSKRITIVQLQDPLTSNPSAPSRLISMNAEPMCRTSGGNGLWHGPDHYTDAETCTLQV